MSRRKRDPAGLADILFGATGWLFADLLLALGMVFLLANTTGQLIPGVPPKPTAAPLPTCIPTVPSLPSLSPNPETLTVTIDSVGVDNQDPTAIANAQQAVNAAVAADAKLANQRAGLVLTFGGYGGAQGTTLAYGIGLARAFDQYVLQALGQQPGSLFYPAASVVYRTFGILGVDQNQMQFDVYYFHQPPTPTPSTAPTCS